MRHVAWFLALILITACGNVQVFPDAGADGPPPVDDAGVDAAPDAPACADRACDADQPDSCCPAACDRNSDVDCAAVCGNGTLEPGERCDPLDSCPTTCPAAGCSRFRLDQGGTCFAQCVPDGEVSACANGDGCCPAGCNALNDSDCTAACGNGVVEGGETCDPPDTCPTACPQQGCQLRTLDGAGTCAARCVAAGTQTACANDDGCCPAGCNAVNDSDCAAVCGNGVREAGETCDPLSSCPTACPQQGCQLRALDGAGTCAATCVPAGTDTVCEHGDGCCPAGCNATSDSDCAPGCGNGVVEPGETCDPLSSCPTACPQQGCQLRALSGAGTCAATCVAAGTDTVCENGDGCCPAGCNANTDSDCTAACGNGVIESGETCDPLGSCPTACPQQGCQLRALSGAGTCSAQCVPAGTDTVCEHGDGCCPAGCNANDDSDCAPTCGNGVIESGETCDPLTSCPQACGQSGCQLFTLADGGTCGARCVPAGTETACENGDGCCPAGCDAGTDSDCAPVCGNGVVEPGETCDGNCACGQESDACYTTTGSPGNCDLRCHQPVQACTSGDGCCAYDGGGGCAAGNDAECVGPAWQPLPLREVTYASLQQCDVVRVAIDPEGTYLFTTCSPGGGGTGDPRVTQVVDASGATYAVTSDDCGDLTALPHLAGWQCANDQGALRHFCASPTPGGFRPSGPNAGYLELTVCPYSDATPGSATLWVWYNARQQPYELPR